MEFALWVPSRSIFRPETWVILLPVPLGLLSSDLRGLKRIKDWLTKHSKADESWQNFACARKPSAKPWGWGGGMGGMLQDFPSLSFLPHPEA